MTQMSFQTHQAALAAVTDLFEEKARALSLASLRKLANALQSPRTDAEDIVRAVVPPAMEGIPGRVLKGKGLGPLVSREAGIAAFEAVTADLDDPDWAGSELLGAGETAERIGVARTSLDNWRRAHKVIAFRKGLRNFVYPARQFHRQRPLDGIDRVWSQFGDDDVAWDWLIGPNQQTGGVAPIDWLRKGKIEEVARAAEGSFDFQ